MRSAVAHTLRRLRREESGQSLIVVALAMVVVIGVSAMAINVATWYVKHHQAQVIADSAALAAANCLANPNSGPNTSTDPQCTSGTDTTDATTVAQNYAKANGLPTSDLNLQFNTTKDQVTATATNTGSGGVFANMLGVSSATQQAGSTAAWESQTSTVCTSSDQAAGDCYAIYAANATCGSNDGFINDETGETITGAVHSQGSMNVSNGTFYFNGPITYSSSNCTYTPAQNGTEKGKYTPTAGGNEPANFWPLNYATVFGACGPSAAYQCTTVNGVSGVPSYCTDVTTSSSGFNFGWNNNGTEPYSGHVYCSIGSGTPSTPSTWNGPIIFADGADCGSSSSPIDATFIGGYINSSSSTMYLQPDSAMDNLLMWATDADSAAGGTSNAIELANGNYAIGGTLFAPAGTVNLNSTSASAAFLEAQNVNIQNLSFTGDGPLAPGTSASSTTGSDSLVQ